MRDAAAAGEAATFEDPTVREIVDALSAPRKTLPARLFYDEAGCALFGEITRLEEYYVTRAEMALLDRHAAEIVAAVPEATVLVEYGASDENKGVRLLDASGGRLVAYVPIDIAPAALDALEERMRASRPGVAVRPVVQDFLQPVRLPEPVRTLQPAGFFPGSTIGNLRPAAVVRFLRMVRTTLSEAGEPVFIVGTDLRKAPERLVAAYDDARGVTAAFNRNILFHVNRLTGADLDPREFDHQALWNEAEGRIEMHLRSRVARTVRIAGRPIRFEPGETIHTEDSYKHTPEGFLRLAEAAGWRSGGFWTDPDGLFGVHLLRG